MYRAMKERAPQFDDGQAWGEESEDGVKHNKALLTIYREDAFIFFTKRYSFIEHVFCFLGNF